jgi:DNA-directed RNA polymerase subunit N (RpoN/RPB10)
MDFLAKVMSVCAESFCARRIFIAHRDLLDSVDISDIWR